MRIRRGSVAVGMALCLAAGASAAAASPAETELKAEIDRVIKEMETGTDGILKWDGADRIDIRPHGDGAAAEFSNARITIGAKDAQPARVTLDRFEIRRAPAPDKAERLAVIFPRDAVVRGANGEETRLKFRDATAELLLDAQTGRVRASEVAFAGAHVEDKKSGDWMTFGPLSASSKLTPTADGGWNGPVSFELKGIEFFFAEGPVAGAIDRIGYGAEAAGPDLAALNRVRDRIEALQRNDKAPSDERLDGVIESLSDLASLLSIAKGELTVERFVARAATGEPLVGFDAAGIGGGLTGFSGDAAALRITVKHDGLAIAPMLLDANKVPRRVVVDFGVEQVETAVLRSIIEGARKLRAADAAQKNTIQQQMLGAAARLQPLFRVYDLAIDMPDVGLAATAEVKGSPLAPKGYTATGDIAVRGFDALPQLVRPAPFIDFLPVLAEIGTTEPGADGTPRLKFHLASAPPKWLTVNGNDVSPWFLGGDKGPGRVLRPSQPAMTGDDVRAVQRALSAAAFQVPQSGRYDGATAVAVARFQKRNGLDVNGAVDAATRQKLGVRSEPDARPEPRPGPSGRPPTRQN